MYDHDLDQRFADLQRYLELRFDTIEEHLKVIPALTARVEKTEKDLIWIKAVWTTVSVIVGFVVHSVKDYLFTHTPPVLKP